MRLSVIIPYYNADAWIGKMLDTLLNQDIPRDSYEIIVVDDGSKEEPATLKDFAGKNANIVYIRQENGGLSSARNRGLRVAQGEWVYFCDSDDFVQPQVLGDLLQIGDRMGAEVVFCNRLRVEPDAILPAPRRNFSRVTAPVPGMAYVVSPPVELTIGVWSYLIRRDLIVANGLRFRDLVYVEDRMFMMDWLPLAQRVIHVDVDLYYYVQRPSSILHAQMERRYEKYADYAAICQEKLREMSMNPDYSEDFRREMAKWLDNTACTLLLNLCKYTPVENTVRHLDRLAGLGAYPLQIRGTGRARKIRILMNHRRAWVFFCRIFRLLPASLRSFF